MTPEDRALVVVLRQVQWLLDDAAHDIPCGNYTSDQHRQLADLLDELSAHVRTRTGRREVVDASDPSR